MSYFRRYDLITKNTALQREPSPGKYRKLTDDEVCTEWMRTRGRLSASPPATPPLEHTTQTTERPNFSPPRSKPRLHLSDSLLRTLKESSVDDTDDFFQESDTGPHNASLDYGGKLYAVTIGTKPPVDLSMNDTNGDTRNELSRQTQVDRSEEFLAKKKRVTINSPSEKTRPVKGQSRSPRRHQLSEIEKNFVLVTNSPLNVKGMEHCNSDPSAELHQSHSDTSGETHRDDGGTTARAAISQKVSSNEDALSNKMGNQETKHHSVRHVTVPEKEAEQSLRPENDQEDPGFFSEREVCANSTFNTSQQSAYNAPGDDDTLNSVSSDEVNVYVDSAGKVKDAVETKVREPDRSVSVRTDTQSRSFENGMATSPENDHRRQRYDVPSPSGSSEIAGGSTPDDSRSLSNSSRDASRSQSREAIVIPKIRINGGLAEDPQNSSMTDQRLNGSQDVSVETEDSFDGAIAGRSHRSSIDSGTGSDPIRQVHNHFVVVAIDFGTTYSGYAFSFNRQKEKIHIMRKWEGGDPGVINQKTLTTILLTPDEKFHSFGFTARDTFHNLKPQDSKKWHYFEKFKMVLHYSTELNKETCLRSSNGSLIPAINIFTFALEFFKTHALQELSDLSGTRILNEDVRWVITVPAIWRAQAKQFMRQAAYQAGIASEDYPDQLLIALEPEAASVCCRKLRMCQVVHEPQTSLPPLVSPRRSSSQPKNLDHVLPDIKEDCNPKITESVSLSGFPQTKESDLTKGTRYMVVDCGGGTVDITVHEIQDHSGRLRELYKATGGPYGSVGVDIEFENLLCGIFGTDFIHHFQQKRPAGWDDLMIAFESRKRSACPEKDNSLNVSLPFSFIDLYKKTKSSQIESAVRKYGDPHIRWSSQGMLRLAPEAMRRLFLPTLNRIKQTVGDIMNHPDARALHYLFLVGGFAESRILQNEIRKEFGHIVRVIIPQGVSLAILEGAVLFGWDPTVVNIRRSRMTYGIGVLNRFDPEKHPDDKRLSRNGVDWCTDIFECFVKINQSVALGDTVLRSYTPARPGQRSTIINIFCTERADVKFVTDHGVRRCGSLCLDLTDMQYQPMPNRREIQTRMFFGDTEIKVTALDVATGKFVRAGIDFLSK